MQWINGFPLEIQGLPRWVYVYIGLQILRASDLCVPVGSINYIDIHLDMQ